MTNASNKSNVPEFSVSDLAFSLKRTVEDTYGYVRVRGELSRVSIAASGHMYSSLKDDGAVIDAVCWKGVMGRLSLRPEEGLEVICTGKISTFPKSSKYQLVIDTMELAGEGALLKMLEDRRKKLAAEGLFDVSRKVPLPKLPQVIGVVTSPTGAVIRDILHRLKDRMPAHVIVWPALVQGKGADKQITAGIEGLQKLPEHGLPRPDVIIVARGGGSLEDLMAFNEENVVRAAAECTIPLISAVGHETDTTLIDYVSDMRAPTPTGAAEIAVPVRADLLNTVAEYGLRLTQAANRIIQENKTRLDGQSRALGTPDQVLDVKTQSVDRAFEGLSYAIKSVINGKETIALKTASRLKHPQDLIQHKSTMLERWSDQLGAVSSRLFAQDQTRLDHAGKMLEAYSFQNVLKRGFAVVRGADGALITRRDAMPQSGSVDIEFYGQEKQSVFVGGDKAGAGNGDGDRALDQEQAVSKPKPKSKPKKKAAAKPKKDDRQESLF